MTFSLSTEGCEGCEEYSPQFDETDYDYTYTYHYAYHYTYKYAYDNKKFF